MFSGYYWFYKVGREYIWNIGEIVFKLKMIGDINWGDLIVFGFYSG